jgi:hypothetical protein
MQEVAIVHRLRKPPVIWLAILFFFIVLVKETWSVNIRNRNSWLICRIFRNINQNSINPIVRRLTMVYSDRHGKFRHSYISLNHVLLSREYYTKVFSFRFFNPKPWRNWRTKINYIFELYVCNSNCISNVPFVFFQWYYLLLNFFL